MNTAQNSEPSRLHSFRSDSDQSDGNYSASSAKSRMRDQIRGLVDASKDLVRERPLVAVGGGVVVGLVVGSLTPRLIAQPVGAIALKLMLTRVFGNIDA